MGAQRLLGTGPWAWSGISTMSFLDHGVLVTPWGQGKWLFELAAPMRGCHPGTVRQHHRCTQQQEQ